MKRFFILWNPYSPLPPQKRFATEVEATDIAHEMAAKYSQEFYVLEAKSSTVVAPPPTKTTKLTK